MAAGAKDLDGVCSLRFSDQGSDTLLEQRFISFSETDMDFANLAQSIDEISRRHAGYRKSPAQVAAFIDRDGVLDRIALEKIQRVLINIVNADGDNPKICRVKVFAQLI